MKPIRGDMGIYDHEYMRHVPEYLRLTGRGGRRGNGPPPPGRSSVTGGEYPPLGPGAFAASHSARRSQPAATRPGVVLATVGAVAGLALLVLAFHGRLGRFFDHPYAPAPGLRVLPPVAPSPPTSQATRPPHQVVQINGARLLSFGGRFTLHGQAEPLPGVVRVLGRWNGGRWETFGIERADGRRFRLVFPIDHRGTLRLRVIQPNGDEAVGTYRVS